MKLQDQLDEVRTHFELDPTNAASSDALYGVVARLIRDRAAYRALQAGVIAPNISLLDSAGTKLSLRGLLSKGPVVLVFYRGAWCPYCSLELSAFEQARPKIEELGATLVAVSQQRATFSEQSRQDNNLRFPILVDKLGRVAAAYGVRWLLTVELQGVHQLLGADLSIFNGDSEWTLSMPAKFVIGQDGYIAWSDVNPDYTARAEPAELFPILRQLARSRER
ncbi:peroxiredoxin-like family protein [Caballeronia sp. M23-90]